MYASHFFEAAVLNTFNGVTATAPSSLFVGLFLNSPTDTGTSGTEVNYVGYARQPVTFTAPYDESGGVGIRNEGDLLWDPAPTDVGEVRFIGVFDSAVSGAGNMLFYGELSFPLEIRANQQASIYASDILYYAIGGFSTWFKTQMLNLARGVNVTGFTPYLALFDGDPETTGVELSGGAYQRPEMNFGNPAVQVGGQTQIANTNLVRFPSPTATWGNWSWDGIRDAPTAGNLVTKMENPVPEIIYKNYVPQVNVGEYRISLN